MNNASVLPFYLPYRALTNADFGNLLVAGKTMAQVQLSSSSLWVPQLVPRAFM
jgi:hypothetical protein